jgi:hypothetical protein
MIEKPVAATNQGAFRNFRKNHLETATARFTGTRPVMKAVKIRVVARKNLTIYTGVHAEVWLIKSGSCLDKSTPYRIQQMANIDEAVCVT